MIRTRRMMRMIPIPIRQKLLLPLVIPVVQLMSLILVLVVVVLVVLLLLVLLVLWCCWCCCAGAAGAAGAAGWSCSCSCLCSCSCSCCCCCCWCYCCWWWWWRWWWQGQLWNAMSPDVTWCHLISMIMLGILRLIVRRIYNPILFYAFYAMLGKIDTDVCALGTAVWSSITLIIDGFGYLHPSTIVWAQHNSTTLLSQRFNKITKPARALLHQRFWTILASLADALVSKTWPSNSVNSLK